ncbi:MAG: WhiB family transcriptional regulator [Candidatus Saccharimonadales bacterium]
MSEETKPTDHASSLPTGHAPLAAPGSWVRQALCATADPGIFFLAHDDPAVKAKEICRRCPVTTDCLQHALDGHEQYGIWGGLNPAERANLRRKLRSSNQGRPSRKSAA